MQPMMTPCHHGCNRETTGHFCPWHRPFQVRIFKWTFPSSLEVLIVSRGCRLLNPAQAAWPESPLRPRRNPNRIAIRPVAAGGEWPVRSRGKKQRLGIDPRRCPFLYSYWNTFRIQPLKFLNNEFAAGKLNIDYGGVVCQEANSNVAHDCIREK